MKLDHHDAVSVITMDPDMQVVNADFLSAINAHLDEVEGLGDGPRCLVLTGEGKTFHQGLDLPYLGGLGDGVVPFLKDVHALFGRLVRLPMPTIAAINGHAIAGGAMIAQCADLRIMRGDRGWFRLPEVELQMPFTVVMQALLEARLPQPARHRLMVLGERMGGADAAAAGVVDRAVDGEDLPLRTAIELGARMAPMAGPPIATIRTALYRDLLAHIAADADRSDLMAP